MRKWHIDHSKIQCETYTPCEHHRICGGTTCFFVNDEGSRSNHRIRSCEQAPGCEFSRLSRRSEGGIAPVSGLNHRSRRRIFEKSRKPLKTLTFSALPNVEKSSNPRSDHMFDHLQKNRIFLPFRGVAKVVSRIVRDDEIAGSSPVTSTKKQPKTSYFDLFSAVFLYIFHKIGYFQLTTCLP